MARRTKIAQDDRWIPVRSKDLVVGDAVSLSMLVHEVDPDGKLRKGVNGQGKTFPVRKRVSFSGRVVGVEKRDGVRHLTIERTVLDDVKDETIALSRVETFEGWRLDDRLNDLRRRADRGPSSRTDSSGRLYLLQMLRDAAGGDHRSESAILRVARCVDPLEVEAAHREDRLPKTLGLQAAQAMLSGLAPYRESVLWQLQGHRDFGRATPNPTDRPIEPVIGIVRVSEPDPEVAAILAALPGAVVREVRRVATTEEIGGGVADSESVVNESVGAQ